MNVQGLHVVVVGLARSGLAASRFLTARGARVTVTDRASAAAIGRFADEAGQLGVRLELGGHQEATFEAADLIVLSPGVPHTLAPLEQARRRGVHVIGEMELAARFIEAPIVAVTGTNGKTTTTELIGRMLATCGMAVFVGGNIGNPLIDIAGCQERLDAVVAEVSSFQLDTMETFRPRVAVLLNITPDHLDRYADLDNYAASKGRVFMNQCETDVAICNGNDPLVLRRSETARCRRLYFFTQPPENGRTAPGALITPRRITIEAPDLERGHIDLTRCALIGAHNRENIAAAALAALSMGASYEHIQEALNSFQALAHRLEPVGEVQGVTFVNDSKATNIDAVIRALECFETPVVLIMGGRNKGYDFAALKTHVRNHVRKLIVIGEAGQEILSALGAFAVNGAEQAEDMDAAVRQAFASARGGDTVLLSPACASFDMFGGYAERGETFRRSVGALR